ncbi:MAG: U32 family peptidase, partial [Lentisphaeria bacterium]|nr:U32 family peptidase [Lentisphaeria bacterium]
LTLEEVADIASVPGLETEVFVHGALCYAYSGLCLLSCHLRGTSGNRGQCSYLCRNVFRCQQDDGPGRALMSMRDLALGDRVPQLAAAGVDSLKIEGRKKSARYVATVVHLHRRLLDGAGPEEVQKLEHDVKTVFSRPWTALFADSARAGNVTDPDTGGHRGAPIGQVERTRDGDPDRLVFTVQNRALERFDGLQIDLPELDRPFGFSVEEILVDRRSVFEAPPGSRVEVALPLRHPRLPEGAAVYTASSLEVERTYRWTRPRPGAFRARRELEIQVSMAAGQTQARARWKGGDWITAEMTNDPPLGSARNLDGVEVAVQRGFEKLGNTDFALGSLELRNPDALFAPASALNELRRQLADAATQALGEANAKKLATIRQAIAPQESAESASDVNWLVKTDQPGALAQLPAEILTTLHEVILDLARPELPELLDSLDLLAAVLPAERIRLAVPVIVRSWEREEVRRRVQLLQDAGWTRWQISNIGGLSLLGLKGDEAIPEEMHVTADWPLYCTNRLAARELLDKGLRRMTLSPEDSGTNLRALLGQFGACAEVVVYQDTPLAFSEACAFRSMHGACPGLEKCTYERMTLVSKKGDRLVAINDHCRSVLLNKRPYSLSSRIPALRTAGARMLRADFAWQPYDANAMARILEALRSGKTIPDSHQANWTG